MMACAIGSSQIHAFGATRELVRRWWQPKKPTASRLIDTWREFSGVCGNATGQDRLAQLPPAGAAQILIGMPRF
jgi:hypothetical protein